MKTQINKIEKIVKGNRLVSKRVSQLRALGFQVEELPMGPGGVLQQRKMANGTTRVQIGYGHGRHNYAMAVTL